MIYNLLFLFFAGISYGSSLLETVKTDINLIVPGAGSEKVILKEDSNAVISAKGYPDSVSEFEEKMDLFQHIYGVESPVEISFNKIFYYERQKAVFFIYDNIVTGIACATNSRITSDSIDLRKGIEYFIFGYGNNKLSILTKSDDRKRDKIYLYQETGIAVIDDGDDDIIDMYIVFPKIIKDKKK